MLLVSLPRRSNADCAGLQVNLFDAQTAESFPASGPENPDLAIPYVHGNFERLSCRDNQGSILIQIRPHRPMRLPEFRNHFPSK
jgi:hypothetical protein